MQATSITDPWQDGHSNSVALEQTRGGAPLESNVSTDKGPIREWVEQLLAAIGLTVDDLKVIGTVGNSIGIMVAAFGAVGWL